jgi:hypothetical protein
MKSFLPILLWLLPAITFAQVKDTMENQTKDTLGKTPDGKSQIANRNQNSNSKTPYKPEILTAGFIDVVNNGQVNASARFIRLYIGEPGKFAIPLSVYSGVSSNNFQGQQNTFANGNNEQLVTNFINPLSGLANLSIDGVIFFKGKSQKYTRAGIIYHFGERILTGQKVGPLTDPSTGKPVNFLNSFAATGFYFQTGAWERNNSKNVGIFWLALRYIGSYTNPSQLEEFLPVIETNGQYYGYSIGWGVEINTLINIKALYYKYTKKPEIAYSLPIYQFSFNYSMK